MWLQVQEGLQSVRQLVCDGSYPWAIVSVWGLTGQPVSWLDAPPSRSVLTEGQNDYSICILPHNDYILMVASGNADPFWTV